MCSHYQAVGERERYLRHFGVEPPADPGKHDVWPGYAATFIRRPKEADVGDEAVPEREVHISAHRGRRFRLNVDAISA